MTYFACILLPADQPQQPKKQDHSTIRAIPMFFFKTLTRTPNTHPNQDLNSKRKTNKEPIEEKT